MINVRIHGLQVDASVIDRDQEFQPGLGSSYNSPSTNFRKYLS